MNLDHLERFRVVRCPNLRCHYFSPADDAPRTCPDCLSDMGQMRAIVLVAFADVQQAIRENR